MRSLIWELVEPIVADPVSRDKHKRNNIQIYTEIHDQNTQRDWTKLPHIHILSLSGLPVSECWGPACSYKDLSGTLGLKC